MSERDSSHQTHLDNVSEAQFVAYVPDDDVEHDVCGILQVVEQRPGPLIVVPVARLALIALVSQLCWFLEGHEITKSTIRAEPDIIQSLRSIALSITG